MKKRLITTLLASILVMAAASIGVSAEWRQTSDNKWNWLDSRGIKAINWAEVNGDWYYFDNSGNMKTGWIKDGVQSYYANELGMMQKGWLRIGELWYHFADNGAMDTDKVIDGYYLGENGIMQDVLKNKVLFENDYAKVTFIGVNREAEGGGKIKVKIENKSDKALCIQNKNEVTVDGTETNGVLNEEIMPKGNIIADFMLPKGTDKNFKNVKGQINIIDKESWKSLDIKDFSIDF